ncbi:MAG: YHS domain-containing protein [Candidatus Sungbacteria bacterium]|uniref:YHS domain-containing protein n=1 Tax=Candidatus Sungiibacteriota bacterium TaxID=2750080 RepID=A0A932DSK4_9BACT|nr:YHS domain-containing protein [Candidatus Sungbacteria bacterium]MBI2466002.1 YHS domain-containing protein [Candidatus Sungbacteria bacterium]
MENKIKSLIKKLRRFGFSVKPKNNRYTDPVCGMETSGDLFKIEYQGKSYYFCSDHCKNQFTANPDNYASL